MPSPHEHESVKGHRDFRRLWAGSVASQFGSAVGMVALPVIAVTVVQATALQVSLLAGITATTTALLAFPPRPPGRVPAQTPRNDRLRPAARRAGHHGAARPRTRPAPAHLMARVATLWSFATTVSQPVFIMIGGLIDALADARIALACAAVLMCTAALLLPRR